jgi:hypothetical protein
MKKKSLLAATFAVLAITAFSPSLALATPEKSVSAAPLEVTYYYLPT